MESWLDDERIRNLEPQLRWISMRAYNCILNFAHAHPELVDAEQLRAITDKELLKQRGLGKKSLREIRAFWPFDSAFRYCVLPYDHAACIEALIYRE